MLTDVYKCSNCHATQFDRMQHDKTCQYCGGTKELIMKDDIKNTILVENTKQAETDDKYIVSCPGILHEKATEQVRTAINKLINGESRIIIFPKDTKLIRIRNGVIEHIL